MCICFCFCKQKNNVAWSKKVVSLIFSVIVSLWFLSHKRFALGFLLFGGWKNDVFFNFSGFLRGFIGCLEWRDFSNFLSFTFLWGVLKLWDSLCFGFDSKKDGSLAGVFVVLLVAVFILFSSIYMRYFHAFLLVWEDCRDFGLLMISFFIEWSWWWWWYFYSGWYFFFSFKKVFPYLLWFRFIFKLAWEILLLF